MRFLDWLFQRPPQPAPVGFMGRETIPTGGYSALELERAGISEEEAQRMGLPLDRHRPSALGSNVMQLEAMVRKGSRRQSSNGAERNPPGPDTIDIR